MCNCKSILLIRLPYCQHPDAKSDDDFRARDTFRPIPSLALATLCGFFEQYSSNDYRLKAIDLNIEAYDLPGTPIDLSVYNGLLAESIKGNQYDILAISVMLVYNDRWVAEAVQLSKHFHPEAKIIIGGGYPTVFPELILKRHDIDYAVIGEGEATFLHIINQLNNHRDEGLESRFPFEGYAFRDANSEIRIIPRSNNYLKLQDLPVPAWHYLNVEKYFRNSGDRILPIEGSRGCPFSCTYCCTHLSWGRRLRYKSVSQLMDEIVDIAKEYGSPSRHFVDDNMSFRKEWILDFLQQLINKGLSHEISFSNFSIKCIDEEIMDFLVKAGVKQLGIAVETGSPEMQKFINKKLDFDEVRQKVALLKNKKFHLTIGWMLGFPGETLEQIHATFELARELRPNSNAFNIVLPYPGTSLYEYAVQRNLLKFDENELDNFGYRKCKHVESTEWTFEQIKDLEFDVTVETTYLDNPYLDNLEDMDYLIVDFERRLRKLPGHIIAHIVLGFIYMAKNRISEQERHYKEVVKLLGDKSLNKIFAKYLLWDHRIINCFNEYLRTNNIQTACPNLADTESYISEQATRQNI